MMMRDAITKAAEEAREKACFAFSKVQRKNMQKGLGIRSAYKTKRDTEEVLHLQDQEQTDGRYVAAFNSLGADSQHESGGFGP